jgi:hypothetical protein
MLSAALKVRANAIRFCCGLGFYGVPKPELQRAAVIVKNQPLPARIA